MAGCPVTDCPSPFASSPSARSPRRHFDVEERIELWGLQIPHNSVRPPLQEGEQQVRSPAQ